MEKIFAHVISVPKGKDIRKIVISGVEYPFEIKDGKILIYTKDEFIPRDVLSTIHLSFNLNICAFPCDKEVIDLYNETGIAPPNLYDDPGIVM